ncbi:hypothetical protein CCP1ISM_110003 [Azospirillaceae bacterium]
MSTAGLSLTNGNGFGQSGGLGLRSTGQLNSQGTLSSLTSSFGAGTVVSMVVRGSDGAVWFAINGVWLGGGNPAAGTNPAGYLTGTLYVTLVLVSGSGGTHRAVLRPSASSWTQAAPSNTTALP